MRSVGVAATTSAVESTAGAIGATATAFGVTATAFGVTAAAFGANADAFGLVSCPVSFRGQVLGLPELGQAVCSPSSPFGWSPRANRPRQSGENHSAWDEIRPASGC